MEDLLAYSLLGNPLIDWLTALGLALSINVVVAIVKWVMVWRLSHLAERTATKLDDALIRIAHSTRQTLILLATLYIGSRYLTLPDRLDPIMASVATVALFLQVGLWGNAAIEFWLNGYRARALETNHGAATAVSAMSFVGKLLLWAFVILLALDNLGVDVTAMVAGLGIGGIAVALAVQNVLGDLLASLSIIVDKPFVIGDFVIVDDFMGTVEHVGLKTTRLRSLGGEQIVFSNSDLLKARLRNYKRMYERRILFGFGVLYQTRADQLEAIPQMVREIVEAQSIARFDRAHFAKFGDSSLDFEVVYWMRDPDYTKYMDAQQAINLALFRRLEAEGIGFAYPTRTLFIEGPVKVESAAAA